MVTRNGIIYRRALRFQLAEECRIQTAVLGFEVNVPRIGKLTKDGMLTVREDKAWDGPSPPAIRTRSFMRGSLAHDVLCQMIRLGYLPKSCILAAHQTLRDVCIEDDMWRIRAGWVYWAKRFMGPATRPSGEFTQYRAP